MRSESLLILLLILGAPLNHAVGLRAHRAWARCRVVGQEPFWLLLGLFSKVTRRQGGTLSSRYRSNGYVRALIQHAGRLSGRHREQAPSHIWIARHQSDSYRPPGRHGSKLPRHRFRATPKWCRYLCPDGDASVTSPGTDTPLSGASPSHILFCIQMLKSSFI